MAFIKAVITRFVSNDQPGFVEYVFRDAWNEEHIIHEKVPVVSSEDLDASSVYPRPCEIDCKVIKEWLDERGRKIISVTTLEPWGIETEQGKTEFDILEDQLVNRE